MHCKASAFLVKKDCANLCKYKDDEFKCYISGQAHKLNEPNKLLPKYRAISNSIAETKFACVFSLQTSFTGVVGLPLAPHPMSMYDEIVRFS